MISKWTKSAVIIAGVILLVTLLFYFGYGYSIRWGGELDSAATTPATMGAPYVAYALKNFTLVPLTGREITAFL